MFLALHILIQIALIVRVLLRPHREPASRIAWVVVIIVLPVAGIVTYILFGEANIGRRRVERIRKVLSRLPHVSEAAGAEMTNLQVDVPKGYAQLFEVGKSVNGFDPVGGNRAQLMDHRVHSG
jgi:cardiolipin synthase